MSPMTDIRVQSVQHDNHSFDLADALVSVCAEVDDFLFLMHFKFDPVELLELALALRVWPSVLFVLLGLINQFLSLLLC